jgi:ribose transport system substrate-binding protein
MSLLRNTNTLIALALAVAAAVLLAACGGSDGSSSEGSTSATGAATETEGTTEDAAAEESSGAAGKKITFVADADVPAIHAVACGMAGPIEAAGASFEYQAPKTYSATEQIPILNAAIATHPDVLVVSPDDPNALIAPLKQAAAEGIPIVLESHELADNSMAATVVTNDDYAAGKLQAEVLAEQIGDRSGEVGYLGYTAGGSTITDARQEGFEDQIKKYSNLEFIGTTVMHTVELEEGAEATNALISAHPNLVGMAANSEDYSIGMAQAIAQRGLSEKIIAVQNEATAKADKLLREGVLHGMASPVWFNLGKEAGEQAVKVAAGESVAPKATPQEPVAVTLDNVDSAIAKTAAMEPKDAC